MQYEKLEMFHFHSTINRHTDGMSHVEEVLRDKLKNNSFSNQVDESQISTVKVML
jgi:hypothetical protein